MTSEELLELLVRVYDVPRQRLTAIESCGQGLSAIVRVDGAVDVFALSDGSFDEAAERFECGVWLPGKHEHEALASAEMSRADLGLHGGPFHALLARAARELVNRRLKLDRAHTAVDALAWRVCARVEAGARG